MSSLILKIIDLQLLGGPLPGCHEMTGKYHPELLLFFFGARLTTIVGVALVTESWPFTIGRVMVVFFVERSCLPNYYRLHLQPWKPRRQRHTLSLHRHQLYPSFVSARVKA